VIEIDRAAIRTGFSSRFHFENRLPEQAAVHLLCEWQVKKKVPIVAVGLWKGSPPPWDVILQKDSRFASQV
jgi:hypothetical protein